MTETRESQIACFASTAVGRRTSARTLKSSLNTWRNAGEVDTCLGRRGARADNTK